MVDWALLADLDLFCSFWSFGPQVSFLVCEEQDEEEGWLMVRLVIKYVKGLRRSKSLVILNLA